MFNEVRLKGLYRTLQSQHSDMPKPLFKSLYDDRFTAGWKSHSSDIPSSIVNNANLLSLKWNKEILNFQSGVTPEDFDELTQNRFIGRHFGFYANPRIKDDAKRTQMQAFLAQQRPEGTNEPVIVTQDKTGKYRLVEGWHRTMNFLLAGAPKQQVEDLKQGELRNIDFKNWRRVKISAWVGRSEKDVNILKNLPGTGDF